MASRWFCKVLGQEMGPVDFREMAEMARQGTLKKDDPVRRKECHQWTPAEEVPGLFGAAEQGTALNRPPDPGAAPQQGTNSSDAPAPPDEETPRRGRGALVWLVGTALFAALVALGLWRWSLPPSSEPIAAFIKVVGGTKTMQAEEFSFTSPKHADGIVVSYKCHSQSESNYNENTVALTLRLAGEVIGQAFDSYESQTDWGDITEIGFWHSEEFSEVSLAPGDRVDLTITVEAGDYMNWVSEITIRPLREGVSYPNDREFHGSQ